MTTMTIENAMKCLKVYVEQDIACMLWGEPGIGKSEGVHALAKELGVGMIDMRLSLRDPVDLRGLPLVDSKTESTRWLSPAELPQVKRDGERGFLFLDEINLASTMMQGAAFGLIQERRLGEYKLPVGWIPIAAGNRMIDRGAAQRMPTPLRNRFAHLTVTADLDAWTRWATKASVHPAVIAFVRFRPEHLHKMPTGDENCFPTPRSWAKVAKLVDVPEAIRQHVIAGVIGDGIAAEFEGFMRIWKGLPSIDQIFKDPMGVHVPNMNEPAALYAVSAALARRSTKQSFGAALTYAARMPKEFQMLVAVDAIKRDPALKDTKAFADWAVNNSDVTL